MIIEIVIGFIVLCIGIFLIWLIGFLVGCIMGEKDNKENSFLKGGLIICGLTILILSTYVVGKLILNFLGF